MAPQAHTYTATRTRTEAVVDQFDMFLRYCMVNEGLRELVLLGVNHRWVHSAAAYITDAVTEKRILEAFVMIDWEMHSDLARLTPTIVSDLPGWDKGSAPEIQVIGRRFGREAKSRGRPVHCWVSLTSTVRGNPSVLARANREMRISGSTPDWASAPTGRTYPLLDLSEQQVGIRSVGDYWS